MLPPLKSLILKWGLLAQWLYWAKYLQAILACPAILLPGYGIRAYFLIISLSGYGQFMLSTSFLPLHGCWSLHYDLCPSYFHTHSDRLFRIISTLSLSFHIYSIFYWKERNGLPLSFSLSFHTLESYHQASDCTENDNSQMFCQEVSSVLLSDRSENDMLCSILFLFLGFNVLTDHFYCSACYWHFYKHW